MKKYNYPDVMEIKPVTKPVNATMRVPGSKSITNRALVLGALASRDCAQVLLNGVDQSDDTSAMAECLTKLGFRLRFDPDGFVGAIANPDSTTEVPTNSADLFVGNSGTTMRFLTSFVSLGYGRYRIDGDARMRQRPIEDLLIGLRQLGVNAYCEFANGCPPVVIETIGLRGGNVCLRSDVSSQFVSALLMVAPYAQRETVIEIEGDLVSEPFVEMTLTMMTAFGVGYTRPRPNVFRIPANQRYWATMYEIEPDATAASYFFGAAAIAGGSFRAADLGPDSIQGDLWFRYILGRMGCAYGIMAEKDTLVVGRRTLSGITVDMNAISDTVMTLAAVACFAEGPTTIRNVAHIRHKECDRITALCTELRKLGVEVEEYPDGLKITPRPMHGAVIETYNDHRMAMSMALIGLKVPGVVIKNPGCVAKTYPGYWEDFQKLYV